MEGSEKGRVGLWEKLTCDLVATKASDNLVRKIILGKIVPEAVGKPQ